MRWGRAEGATTLIFPLEISDFGGVRERRGEQKCKNEKFLKHYSRKVLVVKTPMVVMPASACVSLSSSGSISSVKLRGTPDRQLHASVLRNDLSLYRLILSFVVLPNNSAHRAVCTVYYSLSLPFFVDLAAHFPLAH